MHEDQVISCVKSKEAGPWLVSIVSLKKIEHGLDGDLIIMYPKPYSIYLRGTIRLEVWAPNMGP